MDVSALIVNYGTAMLTRMAGWSLVSLYPQLDIVIFDNASPDDSLALLTSEFDRIPNVRVHASETNRHHGPAMDQGIRNADHKWVLLFDSDCLAFRSGFLEKMFDACRIHEGAYMVGDRCVVDDDGFNQTRNGGHAYIHPRCALVDRDKYLELPPFEKHGAPCLTNQIAATLREYPLVHFPVDDFVFHLGRGTVNVHGYGLGWRSALSSRLAKVKRLFGKPH